MNITRIGSLTILRNLAATQASEYNRFTAVEPAEQPQPLFEHDPVCQMHRPGNLPDCKNYMANAAAKGSDRVFELNGVTLITTQHDSSPFNALHGCIETSGKLDHAEQILFEPDNIRQWLDGLEHIQVIDTSPENDHFTLHASTRALPLLIPAREVTLDCQRYADPEAQTVLLTMTRREPEPHQGKKAIYVKALEGILQIKQTGANTLQIDFSCHTDPGGALPASIVNHFSAESAKKSLSNAKALLSENPSKE